MAAEEALKIDAAEWETSATAAIDRPKKEQLLPEAIVSRAYKAIEERHILLTLDPGMQRDMFEHEEAAKNLGAEAEAKGNPELYYAAAVVYYNCGFLYHRIYNVGHGTQREPRLRAAIHYFELTVQFAERAVKVWRGRDAAGMKPPGPPVAEFLAPPAGGRRRTRRRMKNPCWKGYKAYGFGFLKGKSKKVMPVPPNFPALAVDELLKEMNEPIPQDEVDNRVKKLKKEWLKKHSAGSRLMSKKYCRKTPCRRMGFTQKASCRPYKKCYTRRR